jgi:hypothetical protein
MIDIAALSLRFGSPSSTEARFVDRPVDLVAWSGDASPISRSACRQPHRCI